MIEIIIGFVVFLVAVGGVARHLRALRTEVDLEDAIRQGLPDRVDAILRVRGHLLNKRAHFNATTWLNHQTKVSFTIDGLLSRDVQ